MIVTRYIKNGRTEYRICADCKETHARYPYTIMAFEDLPTAVLVLKYLRGDRMTLDEQAEAKEAIKNYEEVETNEQI